MAWNSCGVNGYRKRPRGCAPASSMAMPLAIPVKIAAAIRSHPQVTSHPRCSITGLCIAERRRNESTHWSGHRRPGVVTKSIAAVRALLAICGPRAASAAADAPEPASEDRSDPGVGVRARRYLEVDSVLHCLQRRNYWRRQTQGLWLPRNGGGYLRRSVWKLECLGTKMMIDGSRFFYGRCGNRREWPSTASRCSPRARNC